MSGPIGKAIGNIKSPLVKNFVANEIVGVPTGALFGGAIAAADEDPNTSFWDGAWQGAKTSFVTSGLSAVGGAAKEAKDDKVNFFTENPKGEMVNVGRWMSEAEYDEMKSTGRMVEGAGGQTFVATGGSEVFKGAGRGSVYVEFKVPKNSLLQGGQSNWYKVIGPNAKPSQIHAINKQGRQMLPQVRKLSPILKIK